MCFVWAGLMLDDLDPSGYLAYILGPKLGLMTEDAQEKYYAVITCLYIVTITLGSSCAGFVQS